MLTSDFKGIKIISNEEDITDVPVGIEGPEGTAYAGGILQMHLTLGKDFPAAPPKGYFPTKIFHLDVSSNREIFNVEKRLES